MADIHIRREHTLGRAAARRLAETWAEDGAARFGMECTWVDGEGEANDTLEFSRSGISGRLEAAPDHFTIDAKLGFPLGALRKPIEAEIGKQLDALLAPAGATTREPSGGTG